MAGHLATLRPGLHDEGHRARFLEAARRHWFGHGEDTRRCGAPTKSGRACRDVALRGEDRCFRHAGRPIAAARRVALLERVARGEATPEQAARAAARAAASRLRRAWRHDPWALGTTIDLGEQESEFRAALRAGGVSLRALPPAVLDWARWRWRRTRMDGTEDTTAWATALRKVTDRVQAAGPPPPGWDAEAAFLVAGEAVYLADPAAKGSKRRRPDPPPVKPRPVLSALPAPEEMTAEDRHAATLVLIDHGALIERLLPDPQDPRRLPLAWTLSRFHAGEIDHEAWGRVLAALAEG